MMNISSACRPPVQPDVKGSERQHPRYGQYRQYVSALSRQLVAAPPFSTWLSNVEEFEQGKSVVFHTVPGATLAHGWYKHIFHPGTIHPVRLGPFNTEGDAQAATERQSLPPLDTMDFIGRIDGWQETDMTKADGSQIHLSGVPSEEAEVYHKSTQAVMAMLAFALSHDWGHDAEVMPSGTTLRVGCEVKLANGQWVREYSAIKTMQDLRDWAGY
jgi:hypothetical protein